MKTFVYTSFALVCFAFNSILCRLALHAGAIDAASFTAVRLLSGTVTLGILSFLVSREWQPVRSGNWSAAFFLFAYAICFSFAYIGLTAGTGALILFGSVQVTMISAGIWKGERPRLPEWLGLLLAFGGLVYLVLPGLAAPPLISSVLMVLAGIAWGFYTLGGRGSTNPLAETTGNFIRSVPMILFAALPFLPQAFLSGRGVLFAVLSGAVASGLGYAVWYAALRFHTATRAAILQLSVPVLAAAGGGIFLAERISLRLFLASLLILGGIGLATGARKRRSA